MRIVLPVHCFFPGHFYGTETYTLQLAQGLQANGHEVAVFSAIFAGEPPAAAEVTRYEWQGIPVVCFDKNRNPHRRVKDTYYQDSQREILRRMLDEIKPDLVHVTHLINHTAVLLEAAKALQVPLIATFTDFFGVCYNNKLEAADGAFCAGPNRSRSNCVSCHFKASYSRHSSPWTRSLSRWPLSRLAGEASILRLRLRPKSRFSGLVSDIVHRPNILKATYSAYRLAITPTRLLRDAYLRNGCAIPTREIRFGVEIDRSPKPRCPDGTALRVGFIGQLSHHKGPDLLINAIRRLPRDRVTLTIYGPQDQEPGYMARLRQAAEGLPVTFPGTFPREQMAQVLAGFDLLAIPSRWSENGPLVLLNALATHTPVLVSDLGGMTEFLHSDGAGGYRDGFAFPLGDLKSLRNILREAVARPERIRAMSAQTNYDRTVADMVTDTLAAYRDMGLPA